MCQLLLISSSITPNLDNAYPDQEGNTALDLAKKQGNAKCAALLEETMLTAWETATKSTPAMESYLRGIAEEGDEAKVVALLKRKVVNVEAADKVCGADFQSRIDHRTRHPAPTHPHQCPHVRRFLQSSLTTLFTRSY